MAEQTERLLLQVDAATELLRRHLAEGEQPIERFERRADRMAQNVDRSVGEMGKRFGAFAQLADDAAKRTQQSFEASFSQVQKLASTAIKGPTVDGRINVGAEDIRAGAAAAQEQARAFALIADAAQRAAVAEGDTTEATRLFIQATNAARVEAEQKAAALTREAGALERVEIELRQSAEAVDLFVGKHQRIATAAQQERDLAAATALAATEQRALAASADLLRGAIDPMYAAQQRFNQEMDRAEELLRAGVITEREFAQATTLSRQALQAHAQAVAGSTAAGKGLVTNQGALRSAMSSASFQVQDFFTQLSMGANVVQVAVIQGGQLVGQFANVEAAAGTSAAKVVAFSQFMIGPWGLAIQGGLLVLAPLVGKMLEFGDATEKAIEKLKEDARESEITRKAKERYSHSEEGVAAAIRDATAARKEAVKSERSAGEQANINAKANLAEAVSLRKKTLAQLEHQKALLDAEEDRSRGGGEASERAQAAAGRLRERIAATEAALKKQRELILEAETEVQASRIDLANEAAERTNDPLERIRRKYDEQERAAEARAAAAARRGQKVTNALTLELAAIKRNRDAEIEAEQARQQRERSADRQAERSRNFTQFGSPVTGARQTGNFGDRRPGHLHGGIDYAVPVGTPVRATAPGAVDFAGQRGAYGNLIVLNNGAGTTTRFGHLSRFAVEKGQRVEKGDIIGYSGGAPGTPGAGRSTGAHLHYEVRRGGRAVDPRTGRFPTDAGAVEDAADRGTRAAQKAELTAAQKKEAARQKLLDQDTAYTQQERTARERLLSATRRSAETEEQRDALLRESITAEASAEERRIANQLSAGDINAAQAEHLKTINEATRVQRLQNVTADAATRAIERGYTAQEENLQAKLAMLRIDGDLAVTQADRRRTARQILEAEQEMRRLALERIRDTSQDPEQVLAAKRQLARLPDIEEAEDRQSDRDNASPLEQYRDRIKAASDDVRGALEDAAVQGFGRLEEAGASATASAVNDLLGLKGVAADVVGSVIADLARLAIQKAIVAAIGGSFFGFAEGGSPGDIPGFASGGSPGGLLRGPGTGKSDSILALLANGQGAIRVSTGEFIVNEQATREYRPLIEAINARRLPRFATGGSIGAPSLPALTGLRSPRLPDMRSAGRRDRMAVDVRVKTEASPLLLSTVEETSVRTVSAAAEPITAMAESRTMKTLRRPDLPGGWG